MPNTPNIHPRNVCQKAAPGTSTSATHSRPRAASTTLATRLLLCARRLARLDACFLLPERPDADALLRDAAVFFLPVFLLLLLLPEPPERVCAMDLILSLTSFESTLYHERGWSPYCIVVSYCITK